MTETETPLAPDTARESVPAEALDELLDHVHIALVPDLSGIGRLADLQSRIYRNLPPETASRIAWVAPDAFCVVLGYLGRVRGSLIPVLQDVCRRVLPSSPRNLQAQRFSTGHDTEGTPRVVGVGFAVDSYLLELQSRLSAELGALGLEVLPREFVPRLTLARLPEGLGPVMTVLEGLASGFPMTLRFPEADLAARGPRRQKLALERVVLARPRVEPTSGRIHGCCSLQSNRFALPQMLECPRKNDPAHELPCFETGTIPAHPVEEPGTADGKVDSIIHEGTQELVRIGRGRPLGRAALLDAAQADEERSTSAKATPERPRPPLSSQGPRQGQDQRPQGQGQRPQGQGQRPQGQGQRPQGQGQRPQGQGQGQRPQGQGQGQRQGSGLQSSHRDPRAPQRENRPPRDRGPRVEKAEGQENRENRPPRENRERQDNRDKGKNRENRPPRDNRENRPPRERPDNRENRENQPENRENRPEADKPQKTE
jgi:2'-5' RNA ligase